MLGAGAAPAIRGSLRNADIHEYEEAVKASWDASFVQLSAGHLNAGIEYLAGDRFVLYRESWSQRLHTAGALRPGIIALGIPSGRTRESRWWGRPLAAGCMPFGNSDRELELITEPGEAITVLIAEEAHFHRIFASLSGLDPSRVLSGGQFLVTVPDSVAKLRDYWDGILVASANRNACRLALPDIVAGMLDAIELPGRAHHSSGAKSGVFSRVMHAAKQANFAASVPQISLQLGISRRSIEYAFQENVGTSPHAYFILRRLDLCKHAFENANPARVTVAEVATQHGFRELGRFAAIYRRQFGELPSETLRIHRSQRMRVSPIRFRSRSSLGPISIRHR